MAKTPTYTVRVDDAFKARVQDEAASVGVKGWTAMLVILAREAIAKREAAK